MAHKKAYKVDGEKVSEYNKKYYQKYKNKLKKRAKQRLVDNPNLNKDYYKKHKKKTIELVCYGKPHTGRTQIIRQTIEFKEV